MVALGLVLSTVGMDPLGGVARFTFDVTSARGGVSFIAVVAGLFGVAEVLWLAGEPQSEAAAPRVRFRDFYPSREELARSWPPILRGSVVGFLVGLVPGPVATPRLVRLVRNRAAGVPPPGRDRSGRDRRGSRPRGREQRRLRRRHGAAAVPGAALHAGDVSAAERPMLLILNLPLVGLFARVVSRPVGAKLK